VIVVDASVLANVVGDDGADGQLARRELRAADGLAAPDLVDVETMAVLRKRWIAGSMTDGRFAAAVDDLGVLEVDRYPALRFLRRVWELRANVTAYDAVYVALAEALGCELWTADRRLASAPGTATTQDHYIGSLYGPGDCHISARDR
jgi:predicted nucleic acid-binding protein